MQNKNLLNSPSGNLDSHVNKLMAYRDKRHILQDQSNQQNKRDVPDCSDVEMVQFDIFWDEQFSDQHINVGIDMEEMEKRDLELKTSIIEKFNKTSIFINEQQNKMKTGYEGYINQLEKENQTLRILEEQIVSIKDDLRLLEQQQVKYKAQLDILSRNKNADPAILESLRTRIKKLQLEKLELLDLVNINKTKIEELVKRVHNNQRNIFPERSQLIREIESLETQLQEKTYITEEKVIYREIPIRKQQEIIEEIIDYEPPIDNKQYNPDCVCQCKCDCHKNHCHGYSQHHHNKVHREDSKHTITSHTMQNHTTHVQHQVVEPIRSQTIRRSFSRKEYKNETFYEERPTVHQETYTRTHHVKSYKNSHADDETRSTSMIAKDSYRRLNRSKKSIRRSKSRKKQIFDMINNRRKFIEEDKLFMEQSLDFHNYAKMMK